MGVTTVAFSWSKSTLGVSRVEEYCVCVWGGEVGG